MIDLSICIPTYNRRDYLEAAVISVIRQINEGGFERIVEIVISDNCSTDGTKEMVENIRALFKNINICYFCSDINVGADSNYLKVVSLATGTYCWLLGSDDMIADGSLKKVLEKIKRNNSIILFERFEGRLSDMSVIGKSHYFSSSLPDEFTFWFGSEQGYDFFLGKCNGLGAIFSYLSVIVFKREKWNSVDSSLYESFIGTAYVHTAVLFNLLKLDQSSSLLYAREPLVINRTGNDGFYKNVYSRTMLDFDGYLAISKLFEGSPIIAEGICNVIKREHPTINWRMVLLSKREEYSNLINKMEMVGYPQSQISLLNMARSHRLLSLLIVSLSKLGTLFKLKRRG